MKDRFSSLLLTPCSRAFTHMEKVEIFHLKSKGCSFYALAKRFSAYPYEIRELLEDLSREHAAKRHAEGKRYYYGGFHQSTPRRESTRAIIEAAFFND